MKMHDLYNRYRSGELDKPRYIDIMYKKHQTLFEYYDYLKETDIESITIGADSVYVTVRGSNIRLLVDRFDKRFIPVEILNFHSFDPLERTLLFETAASAPSIFDIGANIGWYTLNFARIPGVKRVFSFEPIEYTFNYLKRHVEMNRAHNVSIYNFGLSDTAETKTFFWTKSETGSSSMENIRERRKIEKAQCRVITLDEFMKNRRNSVDLIKCDVEGAELFVFRGGVNTLRMHRPVIFTEALRKWSKKFGYHPDDIIDLLADLGYSCFGYVDRKMERIERVSSELETTNFFFFHKNKHKKIINAKCS